MQNPNQKPIKFKIIIDKFKVSSVLLTILIKLKQIKLMLVVKHNEILLVF